MAPKILVFKGFLGPRRGLVLSTLVRRPRSDYSHGVRLLLAVALLLLAGFARAADWRALPAPAAPSPFETGFVSTVKLSLADDPFYASKLFQSFDAHLQTAVSAPDQRTAAVQLAQAISPDANLKAAAAGLGRTALPPAPAGAILAASALAAPHQFSAVASKLEAVKPGLGAKLVESLRANAGKTVPLIPTALTYGPDGKLRHLFDGSD